MTSSVLLERKDAATLYKGLSDMMPHWPNMATVSLQLDLLSICLSAYHCVPFTMHSKHAACQHAKATEAKSPPAFRIAAQTLSS